MTGITLPNPAPERSIAPPRSSARVRVVPIVAVGAGHDEVSSDRPRLSEDERVPAALISTVLHTTALLLLAFFTLPEAGGAIDQLTARQGQKESVLVLQTIDPKDDQRFDSNAAFDQPVTVSIDTSVVFAMTSLLVNKRIFL